jgi:hypothetical protein
LSRKLCNSLAKPLKKIKSSSRIIDGKGKKSHEILSTPHPSASAKVREEEILDLSIRARMIYIDIMYILHLRGILRQSTVGLPLHCRGLRDDVSFAKDLGVVDAALRENLHAREKPNTPKEKTKKCSYKRKRINFVSYYISWQQKEIIKIKRKQGKKK